MAGHSQFANIKHRKGAQDQKRAKLFTKIAREIIVAVKSSNGQTDPAYNPRLRAAIIMARKENMPNDRINGSIKKGAGTDSMDNYEEIRYEGYGPGGVAMIIEAMTDNRNRTASEVRSLFTKHGGNLGESGSVAFMFDKVGLIHYLAEAASPDAMFEAALEAGANDCSSDEHGHTIVCAPESFHEVKDALVTKFGEPESGRLSWKPNIMTPVDEETAKSNIKLVDALEDNDDVQFVVPNYDIPDAIAEKLLSE
ncbi:MAG: hypothetical protein K0R63_625 [Rickettsiales bacterium]|jgi:YebC/PmpR family DNA-binding regulatory protein|nr:hypothetical protein [Rickettsiales bacterium]